MAAPITLENFEIAGTGTEQESHEFRRGFDKGLEQANDLAQTQMSASVSELTATLNDLAFGYEEALQQILTKLTPLMSQISELVVPTILADTFQNHLADTLRDAMRTECAGGFRILVSPKTAELLTSPDLGTSVPYEILPSVDLVEGQAIISSGEASQVLDLVALTSSLRTALQGTDQTEWSQLNG